MQLSVSWSRLKVLQSELNSTFYYCLNDSESWTMTGNSSNQYYATIIDSNKIDFEDNYKNDAIQVSQFNEALSYLS